MATAGPNEIPLGRSPRWSWIFTRAPEADGALERIPGARAIAPLTAEFQSFFAHGGGGDGCHVSTDASRVRLPGGAHISNSYLAWCPGEDSNLHPVART